MSKRPHTSPDLDQPVKRTNMNSNINALPEDELGVEYLQEIREQYSYICIPKQDEMKILNFLHYVIEEHTKATSMPTLIERDPVPTEMHVPRDWELFLDLHRQLKNILFGFLRGFSKEDLVGNLDAHDFGEFKTIRKFLTNWFTNGQLTAKYIDKHKKGLQNDLIKLESKTSQINISPLDKSVLDSMVRRCESQANVVFINSLVSKALSHTITLLEETTRDEINLQIWAKAFRTVVRSNAHLSDRALFKRDLPCKSHNQPRSVMNQDSVPSLLDFPPLPAVQMPYQHISLPRPTPAPPPLYHNTHDVNTALPGKTSITSMGSTFHNILPGSSTVAPSPHGLICTSSTALPIHHQHDTLTTFIPTPTFHRRDPRTGLIGPPPPKPTHRKSTSDVPDNLN
jgi:hypothetical protein